MHTLLRRLLVAGTLCTLLAGSDPVAAQDAGPVTRPLSEPNITDRLPAPKPSARQGSDGRIVVSWAPIEGAVSYRMWRSVPPTPTAAVTLQNPQQSSYVDADVKTGSTYYYVVAAVNGAGIEGLRAGTTPVTATISPSSTTTAPTVSATLDQQDPPRVYLHFYAPEAVRYDIRRDGVLLNATSQSSLMDYSFQSQPYARQVSYTVTATLANGSRGPDGKAVVLIPAATVATTTGGTTTGGTTTGATTTGGTTSTTGTASHSGSSASASTTLTVAALATLTTGATTSLGSAGGSSARWLSLNDAIATVDAGGIVTARAGGTTQVLAVSSSSDGSVRVVAIPVTVKP